MKNKVTALALLSSLVAALSLPHTTYAADGGRPMIEVGVTLGGGNDVSPIATGSTFAGMVSADARFNFLFLDAQAEFISYGVDGNGFSEDFSVRANGGLFFLKVHDFYMRKDPQNGNHTHTMAGVGSGYDLPSNIGSITASMGAIVMDWERNGRDKNLVGGYIGGNLYLHIWKFENELRIAYYATPKLNIEGAIDGAVNDAVNEATSDLPPGVGGAANDALGTTNTSGTELITGWKKGLMLSNTLRFNVISVPLFTLGPQAQFSMMQMPDGTEFVTTLGFGGRFGL